MSISSNFQHTRSLWMTISFPTFATLREDLQADVCIVGAGIVGLTCAYNLLKQGKSVVILDQNLQENMQSMRTTAHLSWALDDRYFELEKYFGEEGARYAAESHAKAINHIEHIILEQKIDCDFERVDGYLFATEEKEFETLDKEFIAIKKMGIEIHQLNGILFNQSGIKGKSIHFPRQAQFHIAKYLKGLMEAIIKMGGQIFDHTHINKIEEHDTCEVTSDLGIKVTSTSLIIATCTPINDRFYIHTKQAAYRTYVIAAAVPTGAVNKGLYWDTYDPYHYVRLQKNDVDPHLEWLIIGGEDQKTGQEEPGKDPYALLESWARKHFPMITTIDYRWSGQVYEPIDGLAFIGKNPGDKNIYIATGDSGNGMTHGTIAGLLIPDLILGQKNPWENLYDPARKTFSAASEYLDENVNAWLQYGDWLTAGEAKTVAELECEQGMILREGIKKIAVYKDKENKVHFNSAFCPHLGGCVRWNCGEKSWDCPCHGSRFDGTGQVIMGPALSNLEPSTKS